MNLYDFLDAFNLIDRIEGAISSLVNADWAKARQGPPVIGFATEIARTVVGANSWTFYIPRESGWAGGDVEALLRRYGVVVWGRRVTGKYSIMSVKERQANWAEYLILRQAIPLAGRLFNPANAVYARKHAPGDRPPAWADRKEDGLLDRLGDWLP